MKLRIKLPQIYHQAVWGAYPTVEKTLRPIFVNGEESGRIAVVYHVFEPVLLCIESGENLIPGLHMLYYPSKPFLKILFIFIFRDILIAFSERESLYAWDQEKYARGFEEA